MNDATKRFGEKSREEKSKRNTTRGNGASAQHDPERTRALVTVVRRWRLNVNN